MEQRAGGQKRLAFGARQYDEARELIAAAVAAAAERPEEIAGAAPSGSAGAPLGDTPVSSEPSEPQPEQAGQTVRIPGENSRRRAAHYGLEIQFEDRPADSNLAGLVESTVWIDRAHPAYRRALVSRSIGYHIALAVAMSLAPLAVEPAQRAVFC